MKARSRARRDRLLRQRQRNSRRVSALEQLEPRLVLDSTLVFNELSFHPVDDNPAVEWVEFYNQMAVDLEISNWSVSGGITFDFPEGTIVPGRGYLVLAADPTGLEAAGGPAGAFGPYVGSLNNDGETLRLNNNNGRNMNEIAFGDSVPWPVGPDGSGVTLAKAELLTAAHDPNNWVQSSELGGTPGAVNFDTSVTDGVDETLLPIGVNTRVLVPTQANDLPVNWTANGFDDSSAPWSNATTGLGYDDSNGAVSQLLDAAGDIENEMQGVNSSALVRAEFQVDSPNELDELTLDVDYDDGFVAWLNGTEVARSNAPAGTPAWNAAATDSFEVDPYVVTVATDNPVGYWRLGEAGGSFIADNVGSAGPVIDGFYNSMTSVRTGLVGDSNTAANFNGTSTFVDGAGIANLAGGGPFQGDWTIETWFVHDAIVPWSGVFSNNGAGEDNGPGIGFFSNSNSIGPMAFGTTGESVAIDLGAAHIGKPVYVVVTKTGGDAVGQGQFSVYANVDGTWLPTVTGSNTWQISSGNNGFLIGQHDNSFTQKHDGAIDEVAVYGRALSASEIEEHYISSGNPATNSLTGIPSGVGRATVDLTPHIGDLVDGTNVLSIQGLNATAGDNDFLVRPEVTAHRLPDGPSIYEDLAINELTANDSADFYIEITNQSLQPLQLDGVIISSSDSLDPDFVFGSELLQPGQYRAVTEAELGFFVSRNERLFMFDPAREILVDSQVVTNRLRGLGPQQEDWLYPSAESKGTVNVFAASDEVVINEVMYNFKSSPPKVGVPPTLATTALTDYDSSWRYSDIGIDQGAAWSQTTHNVDNVSWFNGQGLIGFEVGVLNEPILTTLTNPANNAPRIPTYYFESDFIFSGDPNDPNIAFNVQHYIDDGAVFYLNGNEVGRHNMRDGVVLYGTFAEIGVGNAVFAETALLSTGLINGINRFSVEVHQATQNSSDIVFGARLLQSVPTDVGEPSVAYSRSTEEWIELHNPTNDDIDLTGWDLTGGINYNFDSGTMIPANDYLVVAKDPAELQAKYPAIEIAGGFSGTLSNGSDLIVLRDSLNNPVDSVEYFDGGKWPSTADGGGSSLELRDPASDNSKGGAWAASSEGEKASWNTYTFTQVASSDTGSQNEWREFIFGLLGPGEVLIDDVSVVLDPIGGGTELIQNGSFQSDSVGSGPQSWRIIGTHSGVVDLDPDNPANRVLRLTSNGATEHQHNHAETTFVNNTAVVNGQTYEVTFKARWVSGVSQLNSRFYLNRVAETVIIDVPTDNGTPGVQNSSFVANAGPTFDDLRHDPPVPAPGETVTVSVRPNDPDGVNSLTLWHSSSGGGFQQTTMTANANGDYSADILGQSDGTVVQFFVSATDGLGETSLSPAAGADSRALFKFDSTADPTAPMDSIRVIMVEAEANAMFSPENIMSNELMGATIIYNNDEIVYDAGFRLKGSPFGRTAPSLQDSFTATFPPDQLFRGVHEKISFDGSSRSNLGPDSHDEILVKQMLNHAGGITSMYDDIGYVHAPVTSMSGTKLFQLARYDSLFLNEWINNGNDGLLYEFEAINYSFDTIDGNVESLKDAGAASIIDVDITDLGDSKEDYRWHYLIKNNRDQDDFSKIIPLAKAFDLSGSALDDATQELIDVDNWMRVWAFFSLTMNIDILTLIHDHNIFLYQHPETEKIMVLPWDMDFSFSMPTNSALHSDPSFTPDGRRNLARIIDLPTNTRVFHGHLYDMIQTTFSASYLQTWADHYASFSPDNYSAHPGNIQQRADFVLSQLPAQIPFEITTNGGADFASNDDEVTLQGDGWIDVREIVLADTGHSIPVTWLDANTWQVVLPLNVGANSFAFQALDHQGNPTGADTIVVTSTVGGAPPVDAVRITEVNYNPHDPEVGSPYDNDDFEFVEIKNVAADPVNLSNASFSQGIGFTFGNVTLNPGEHGLIVRNQAAFESRYGDTLNVVGVYSGGLDNKGETLELIDALGNQIALFTYDDSGEWPNRPDGNASSLQIIDTEGDYNSQSNWRSSIEYGGSPGVDALEPFYDVVVNEVLSHSDLPQVDFVELFNSTGAEIDISGWFLSDSNNNYFKYTIPGNTMLGSGEYLVIDESDFNASGGPNDFAFNSAHGDEAILLAVDPQGLPIRFADDFEFIAQANSESWGRWPNGIGDPYPMIEVTLGDDNTGPRVGPVVITELMYNAPDPDGVGGIDPNDLEFIEIANPTNDPIDLTNWDFGAGIDMDFNANLMLGSGEVLVVLSFEPADPVNSSRVADFRNYYGIDASVQLTGGFAGVLDNGGERVRLLRPDSPPLDEPNFIPLLLEDEVRYDDVAPWPTEPDGTGMSLNRNSVDIWGNDSASWNAALPTPGSYDVRNLLEVSSVELNANMVDPPDRQDPQPTSWAQQRSDIRQIVVTFNNNVLADENGFVLTNLGVDPAVDPDTVVSLTSNHVAVTGNVVVLSFADDELGDGVYELEVLPTVTDLQGTPLDGNMDGNTGDSFVYSGNSDNKFYRFFVDWNGDTGVSVFDFSTFSYWFGFPVGDAPSYVDTSRDGGVSVFDFSDFSSQFGFGINLPVAFAATTPSEINGDEKIVEVVEEEVEQVRLGQDDVRDHELNRRRQVEVEDDELAEAIELVAEDLADFWSKIL
jgi:hypothetical protein